jgi:hypothetical protein
MRRLLYGAVALGLSSFLAVPAFAATATCGNTGFGGIFIGVTVGSGTPSCLASGNGTKLATAADPTGLTVLDTTQTGVDGAPALTVAFDPNVLPNAPRTDGTFMFDPTGFTNFAVGFQFRDQGFLDPNPDWIVVGLPDPAGSGSFDADLNFFAELPSDAIEYAVLYGTVSPANGPSTTPLPAAVWLMGTVLAGAAGIKKYRNSRGSSASCVAA